MKRSELEKRLALVYALCHKVQGSGVDSHWALSDHDGNGIARPIDYDLDTFQEKTRDNIGKAIRIDNSFHCLDEHGSYCGWADFSIIFPNNKPIDEYRLVFRGQVAQQLQRKHDIREYLDQLIIGAIYDIQKEQEDRSKEANQG